MARINVDQTALTDPRFVVLGLELGAPPEHARAVGLWAAIRVWNHCIETGAHRLEPAIVDGIQPGLASALISAKLGSMSRVLIRVHGTKGRIEYLTKLRESNRIRKRRSRVSHADVTRDNPGAPAPAPALNQEEKTSPARKRAVVAVSPAALSEVRLYEELCGWPADKATFRSAQKLLDAGKGEALERAREAYAAEIERDDKPREYRIRPHNWYGRAARYEPYAKQVVLEARRDEPFVNRLLTPEESAEVRRMNEANRR